MLNILQIVFCVNVSFGRRMKGFHHLRNLFDLFVDRLTHRVGVVWCRGRHGSRQAMTLAKIVSRRERRRGGHRSKDRGSTTGCGRHALQAGESTIVRCWRCARGRETLVAGIQ